jgi:hypothetical protein
MQQPLAETELLVIFVAMMRSSSEVVVEARVAGVVE